MERNAPCQWNWAINKAQPPVSAAENDRAMIRQICNIKPRDTATFRSTELLARLGVDELDLIVKERRLRWYGHVECSNGAVKTALDIQVDGKRGSGRPKMTWRQLTERDYREWKLSAINPHDRHLEIWCEICHVCSKPVTWKGGPLMWILPLYLHVNQKSDDDDDDDDDDDNLKCYSVSDVTHANWNCRQYFPHSQWWHM